MSKTLSTYLQDIYDTLHKSTIIDMGFYGNGALPNGTPTSNGSGKKKQLHLTAFMRPVSLHTGAWRYPGSHPDANFNLAHLKSFIQKLEEAKFDAFFMADHLAVLNMPLEALKRSHTTTSFEPFTLLSALSQCTSHIGLAATASTTYDEPYHIARRFASLDHISNGRAAWNIVTTGNPESSKNFGQEEHREHGDRYRRAREFYDVVTGLWDSFADDAFLRDKESGVYMDPERMHVLNHKGEELSVRGPLNVARPIQGWVSPLRHARLIMSADLNSQSLCKPANPTQENN